MILLILELHFGFCFASIKLLRKQDCESLLGSLPFLVNIISL
ncbi:hypothetical protein GLYMA_19G087451v4 [Glycine max]|nr:hypothetical protein GLYMA_19G087451v4 [Glycine max]KAH1076973.1 hypothetical protein GYH30_052461 [Glycine max]